MNPYLKGQDSKTQNLPRHLSFAIKTAFDMLCSHRVKPSINVDTKK